MSKAWFITGASRGFGREIALAALKRGDTVAATVRADGALADLKSEFADALHVINLDVTDRSAVLAAVDRARSVLGRIDVVVNNAGYGLFGAVEEVSEEQSRRQMEVNFFGALWVVQAVLPILREQGAGHIIQISSIGGVTAYPMLGIYHASKWALEGFTESLAQEVAGFGIATTIVEPGGYATDWGGSSAEIAAQSAVYQGMHDARAAASVDLDPGVFGAPSGLARELVALTDEATPPKRALLGAGITDGAIQAYNERIAVWEAGRDRAEAAHR